MRAETNRGYVGRTPRLPSSELDAYQNFCEGVRSYCGGAFRGPVMAQVNPAIAEAEKNGADLSDIKQIRATFDHLPAVMARNRLMRSIQEMTWRSLGDAFYGDAEKYAAELDAYDKSGPGSVEYDPNWEPPAYTRHPIHIQPGGYTDGALAGYVYHHGTNVFFEGMNDQDRAHRKIAEGAAVPADGKVERILDIGCSIGQTAIALKERFPDAEVRAVDVGAPMVRYAHKLAVDWGVEVHFAQKLAEDTGFPDGHFDMVTAFILFHEVPTDKAEAVVAEAFRVLRPGGTFSIFDFPYNVKQYPPFLRYFMEIDKLDNCEPYALGFTQSDFIGLLERTGFKPSKGDDQIMAVKTILCEKPA